eukprot:1958985-Rhodomonas_salina.1
MPAQLLFLLAMLLYLASNDDASAFGRKTDVFGRYSAIFGRKSDVLGRRMGRRTRSLWTGS